MLLFVSAFYFYFIFKNQVLLSFSTVKFNSMQLEACSGNVSFTPPTRAPPPAAQILPQESSWKDDLVFGPAGCSSQVLSLQLLKKSNHSGTIVSFVRKAKKENKTQILTFSSLKTLEERDCKLYLQKPLERASAWVSLLIYFLFI